MLWRGDATGARRWWERDGEFLGKEVGYGLVLYIASFRPTHLHQLLKVEHEPPEVGQGVLGVANVDAVKVAQLLQVVIEEVDSHGENVAVLVGLASVQR